MTKETGNLPVIDAINQLKARLLVYSETEGYRLGNYSKAITAAIMIAISLTELKLFEQRDITEEEKRWFEGGYQVCRHFEAVEERDICELYSQLVEFMLNKKSSETTR